MLIEKMRKLREDVTYSDPHIPVFPKMREHQFDLTGVTLTPQSLADFDGVLLATGHYKFDYPMIKESAKIMVDSRGRYAEQSTNITKA